MSNDFYTLVTTAGRALEVQSKAGNTSLNLTKLAVGDGNGAVYNPTGAEKALKKERWRGDLNALYKHPDNPAWLVAECVLPDQVGGWWVREVGLFTGTGVLYAIAKYPETYKPVFDAGANKMLYIRMIFEVTNAASVTLLVDPSVVMATRQYVDLAFIDRLAPELAALAAAQVSEAHRGVTRSDQIEALQKDGHIHGQQINDLQYRTGIVEQRLDTDREAMLKAVTTNATAIIDMQHLFTKTHLL